MIEEGKVTLISPLTVDESLKKRILRVLNESPKKYQGISDLCRRALESYIQKEERLMKDAAAKPNISK